VNNFARALPWCCVLLVAAPTAVLAQAASDPELAQFRSAYTSGEGLAYVVIKDERGERIYRYGDISRLTARQDPRGYVLFSCALPHVFAPHRAEDRALLKRAEVVTAADPRFAELDAKYLAGCHNPFVKSALGKPRGGS